MCVFFLGSPTFGVPCARNPRIQCHYVLLSDILVIKNGRIQCKIGQFMSILIQKMWSFWNPKNASLKKYSLNRKNEQKMVIIFEDLKTPHFLGTGFWDPGFHQIGVVSRLPGPYRARILRPWIPSDWRSCRDCRALIGAGF